MSGLYLECSDSAKLDLSGDVDSGGDSEEYLIEVVEYDFNMDKNVKFMKKVGVRGAAFLAWSPSCLLW